MGETDWGVNWVFVLMGRAMISKTFTQFSVEGRGCIPSLLLDLRPNMVEVSKVMVNTKIRLTIFFAAKDGEALYSQQKRDLKLTVAQMMNSLLPNSDLN